MLVTSCPECATTFRVTEEILDQADGQVRCGRCSQVFNGILSLSEQPDAQTFPVEPLPQEAEYDGTTTNWFLTDVQELDETPRVEPQPDAAVARIASDSVEETAADSEDTAEFEALWLAPPDAPASRRTALWTSGALLLVLALGGQIVHAFHTELAPVPVIGGPLTGLYSRLGIDLAAAVDLGQYELLELASVAGQSPDDQAWLLIEARLKNNGPKGQAFPQIFVALQDRWQKTVAGRYFEPGEYAATSLSDGSRMNAGQVVDAQLIIVDPGPEVTGFELQICTRVEQGFVCDGDALFD